MRDFPFPVYLRAHRKRWALSQPQLATLLGVAAHTTISRYELSSRHPTIEALIGSEFVFGEPARKLFPSLYSSVERGVMHRVGLFAEIIGDKDDGVSRVQRELLEAIAVRAATNKSHI